MESDFGRNVFTAKEQVILKIARNTNVNMIWYEIGIKIAHVCLHFVHPL